MDAWLDGAVNGISMLLFALAIIGIVIGEKWSR